MEREFDECKQQQKRKQEEERKELLRQRKEMEGMESRHLDELAHLISHLDNIYSKREANLRRQIPEKKDENQRDQNNLKLTLEKESAESRKKCQEDYGKLQLQHKAITNLAKHGNNDTRLLQQQLDQLQEEREKEIDELRRRQLAEIAERAVANAVTFKTVDPATNGKASKL